METKKKEIYKFKYLDQNKKFGKWSVIFGILWFVENNIIIKTFSVVSRKLWKKLQKRKNILDTFLKNPGASFSSIARLSEASKATARNVIDRFKNSKSIKRKPGSERIPGFVNKKISLECKESNTKL